MFDFLIHAAHAATTSCPTGQTCLQNPFGSGPEGTSIPVIAGRIINAGMGIVGSVTLLVFVYGGFLWLTSAGDMKKVEKGKDTMKWAAVGLVIIFSAYALVGFVFRGLSGL